MTPTSNFSSSDQALSLTKMTLFSYAQLPNYALSLVLASYATDLPPDTPTMAAANSYSHTLVVAKPLLTSTQGPATLAMRNSYRA